MPVPSISLAHLAWSTPDGQAVFTDLNLDFARERTGLIGRNGVGKSTLFHAVIGELLPWSGRVTCIDSHALLDQRVNLLDPRASLAENFARHNPGVDNNQARAALARFQFRGDTADRLAGTLSGGQLLRAGLACVLGGPQPPALLILDEPTKLILDEPTNHLDLESIRAVEAGLRNFDGALLVASHDTAFLDNIGITRCIALSRAS